MKTEFNDLGCDNENYSHLLLVSKFSIFSNADVLYVYRVKTDDIYHTMGEYIFRSMERVKRITFTEYTDKKIEFWKEQGFEILDFKDKFVNERS